MDLACYERWCPCKRCCENVLFYICKATATTAVGSTGEEGNRGDKSALSLQHCRKQRKSKNHKRCRPCTSNFKGWLVSRLKNTTREKSPSHVHTCTVIPTLILYCFQVKNIRKVRIVRNKMFPRVIVPLEIMLLGHHAKILAAAHAKSVRTFFFLQSLWL